VSVRPRDEKDRGPVSVDAVIEEIVQLHRSRGQS